MDPGDPVTPLPYSSPTLPPENYREGVVEPPTVQHTVLFFSKRDNIVVILCVPRTTRHAREGTVVPGDPVLCTRGQFTLAVSSHGFFCEKRYEPNMARTSQEPIRTDPPNRKTVFKTASSFSGDIVHPRTPKLGVW